MFNVINELLGCLSNTPKLIMVKLKSLISFNELIIKNCTKTNRLKPFHKKQYTYDLFCPNENTTFRRNIISRRIIKYKYPTTV